MNKRKEQYEKLIHKLTADFISRESNKTSLITVTRVDIDENLRSGIVLFTTLPKGNEAKVTDFLNRKRRDLHEYLKKNMRSRIVPSLQFIVDVKDIDQLSKDLN